MAARVERSRTKTQQMEGTELTPIQVMVVRVECYVQDLMQKSQISRSVPPDCLSFSLFFA